MTQRPPRKEDAAVDKGEAVRAAMTPDITDPFDDGDVIRFKVGKYNYAAIKVCDYFFTTGHGGLVPKEMTFRQLTHMLATKASDIKWTDQWKDIK